MAKLVFGMMQSLDGYVDHQAFAPGPALFRYWIEHVRNLTGSVYGRRMYEIMRVLGRRPFRMGRGGTRRSRRRGEANRSGSCRAR